MYETVGSCRFYSLPDFFNVYGLVYSQMLSIWSSWAEPGDRQMDMSFHGLMIGLQHRINWIFQFGQCIIYNSQAPFTAELVFRACMISLLLCGGFKPYTVILLSPVLFSLGFQLGYTVIFGSYASFLFVRTGW
ncbi:putative CAAX prenyl protease 2 [Helianthus debilis subsp. tardiflorus]